jgi:hypothetical protein
MKENLSTTTSITSTYAGEFNSYVQAALLAGKTLGEGNIKIMPNVKYKTVLKKLATSDILAAGSCDFSATGTVALTEKILEPKTYQVNLQLCKSDFRSDWEAIEMGMSANDNLPKTFEDFIIANQIATVGAALEGSIWKYDSIITGFTYLFKADETIAHVTGTTITAANVIAELGKVVAKASTLNTWNSGEKPVIYASTNIYMNYMVALGGFGASGLGSNGYKGEGPNQSFGQLYFAGIKVIETPGLPANEMVCAQPSNLIFATGLMSDQNECKVIDMAPVDGSQNVRFVMRFTANVGYVFGQEIVYYS